MPPAVASCFALSEAGDKLALFPQSEATGAALTAHIQTGQACS
jgi:hypothetical protein